MVRKVDSIRGLDLVCRLVCKVDLGKVDLGKVDLVRRAVCLRA